MFRIVRKKRLNPTVTLMEIDAPLIAKKAEPGQFIILRVDENGERIPLTVADYDREGGTVTIIFQIVGATTEKLNALSEGEYIRDFVGPLGKPSNMEGLKRVAVVGGGKDDAPIQHSHSFDLTAASDEELDVIERVIRRTANPGGDQGGAGAPEG